MSPPGASFHAVNRRAFLKRSLGAVCASCAGGGLLAGCSFRRRVGHRTGDRIRLRYWEKWGGSEAPAMRAVVDAFNAKQDRIVIDYLSVSQIDRKTAISIAGGDPPDIAGLWSYNLPSFADMEAILPLGPLIKQEGGDPQRWLERFIPSVRRMFQYRDGIYGVPSTPSVTLLHWNKAMFRQAGLDPERPPRTLDELGEMARALSRRDPQTGGWKQIGFLPQEPGFWSWAFPLWFGGSYFDGAGDVCVGKDVRNVEAMRWVRDWTGEYGLEAIIRFTSGCGGANTPQGAFFNHKVAMVLQGVWLDHHLALYAPDLDYGVAAWPHVPGTDPNPFAVVESDALVICRGTRHPEAAWEFLKFVSSIDPGARSRDELTGSELLCYGQQKNSPMREWSPYFSENHPHHRIAEFREIAQSPNAIHTPVVGIWEEYRREIKNAFDTVRILENTPEKALAYAQRRVGQSWDRYRKSLERHRRGPTGSGST